MIFNFYGFRVQGLFMNNMKGFILGFSLSILGICLYEQPATPNNKREVSFNNYKIDLFKEAKATTDITYSISNVKKETIFASTFTDSNESADDEDIVIALNDEDINGVEDEEILTINTEDIIPIEINNNPIKNAQIATNNLDEKVAMLPSEDTSFDADNELKEESPWIIAKGGKHIDNKMLLEDNINVSTAITPDETIIKEDLSFEVAQKIKQNIIFPIPDEILNDEDLTPTFITSNSKTNTKTKPVQKNKEPKILEKKKVEVETTPSNNNQNTIINNISSWFNKDGSTTEEKQKRVKTTPPIYSTQDNKKPTDNTPKTQDFGEFYEALQKTKQAHSQKRITPSELKLSFNPERAEISGQTLRWLKAFSEKTNDESCFIQVMLDATTSTELQRKRLNLLYTIFINNNVDLNKVDTVFTNIEPNTFIIRTITLSKPKL